MGKEQTVKAVTHVADLIKHEARIISGGGVVQKESSWVLVESPSSRP